VRRGRSIVGDIRDIGKSANQAENRAGNPAMGFSVLKKSSTANPVEVLHD
jgi:hypothetical protein